MPLYPSGRQSDAQKEKLLDSIYLATVGFVRKYTGNRSHYVATSVREIATEYTRSGHSLRSYIANTELGNGSNDRPLFGFGFPFARYETTLHMELARTCIIDFGTWNLNQYFHFMCKLIEIHFLTNRRTTYKLYHLGACAFVASDFTKGQNPHVLYQRERALGAELLNKAHYAMWLELAKRLGMGRAQWDNLATYRQFMQTGGSQPRVERSSRDRSRSSGRYTHDRSSSRGRSGFGHRRDEPGSSRRRSPSSDRREPAPKRGRSGSYIRRYW